MRNYLLTLSLFLIASTSIAQEIGVRYRPWAEHCCVEYGDAVSFTTGDVASDYGRRDCETCQTQWHKGVDLSPLRNNQDLGFALMAIEGGTVTSIRGNHTLKAIHINSDLGPVFLGNSYGYAHIFENEIDTWVTTGNFHLVQMQPPFDAYYAIVTPDLKAIGEVPGTVLVGSLPLLVETTVNRDQNIAPLGNSGFIEAHLHLHSFKDLAAADSDENYGTGGPFNTSDPLEDLTFQEATYDITIPNVTIRYGEEESSIMVRTRMQGEPDVPVESGRHQAGVMSIDHVELEIKSEYADNDAYQLIQGPSLRSEITLGGRITPATTIYPSNIWYPDRVGSDQRTGIAAYAYSTNPDNQLAGRPWDDYYFSDFNTRIKSDDRNDIASVNQEARYKDGDYNLRAKITTITDREDQTDNATTITIDNFLPYVKNVVIRSGGPTGKLIYRGVWEWDGSSLTFDSGTINRAEPTDNLWVKITTSESMQCLQAGIGALSGVCGPDGSNSNTEWVFSFPAITTSGDNTLHIHGLDKAGNQLNTSPEGLPVAISSTTFSGTSNLGTDMNHIFQSGTGCNISEGGGSNDPIPLGECAGDVNGCIYAGIDIEQNIIAKGEPLVFSSFATDATYTYTWDFGSSASAESTDSSGPITVVFNSEGTVNVSLEICDSGQNCACTTETIIVSDSGVDPFNLNFSAPSWSINTFQDVTMNPPIVNGASGTLNYYWSFGSGVASVDDVTSVTPTVSYRTSGQKNVSLTVSDDIQTVTKTINSFFNVSELGWSFDVEISAFTCIPASTNNHFQFSANLFGDDPFDTYTYYWDFGDGHTYTTTNPSEVINHYYDEFGEFTVYLKVCDSNGTCAGDYKTDCINVIPPPPTPIQLAASFKANDEFIFEDRFLPDPDLEYTAARLEPISLVPIPRGGDGEFENYTFHYWIEGGHFSLNGSEHDDNQDFIETIGPEAIEIIPVNYSHQFYEGNPDWNMILLVELIDESGDPTWNVGLSGKHPRHFYARYPMKIDDAIAFSGAKCFVNLGEPSLSYYCYEPSNGYPELSIPIGESRCSGDIRIRVEQITDGGNVLVTNDFQPGNSFDFSWLSAGDRPSSFPYSGTFIAKAYLENDGSSILAGSDQFSITLNAPPQFDAGPDVELCKGASATIGTDAEGYSYSWSSNPASNLNLLSSTSIGNPTFTAVNSGVHTYTLTATDLSSGCTNTDQVVVNVNGISASNTTIDLQVGTEQSIDLSVSGGGSDYEYVWTPSTYLDDPTKASPIFSAPDIAESISYSVDVSFRGACSTTSTVNVNVLNDPPDGLTIVNDDTMFPKLFWYHEGVAQSFEIRRSNNGGASWSTIATVGGNTFEYQDITCANTGTNYCYKIRGRNLDNQSLGTSNEECTTLIGVAEDYVLSYSLPLPSNTIRLTAPVTIDLDEFEYQWSPSTFLDDPTAKRPNMTIPNYGTTVNYTVDISYQGICSATANVAVNITNPPPTDFSVGTYGVYPNSQFPTFEWVENGIVNYYVLKRSVNGGPYEEVTRGDDIMDHIDFDCIYSAVEYCYILEVYDYQGEYITVGPSCTIIPYVAGLTGDFPHSVDGSAYDAINKSTVFNGFGGSTIIPIQNFGNAKFGSVDAASGSPVLQLDFRDGTLNRVGPHVISNGSYEFWPTGMCETDNYFFIVGATNESGYEDGILNLIRYTKSNGAIYRRRLKTWTGNAYMKLNAPAYVADLGNDDFVVAASYGVGTDNVGVWSIMKPLDWAADTWEYENYALTSSYDVYMSDLDIHNGIVYVTIKYRGVTNGSEHFRSVGYEIRRQAPFPDRFDQEYYASASAQASVPIHPKSVFHSNMFYSVSEMGTNEIYVKQETHELNRRWAKSFTLSQSDFEVKALEIFEGELFAVSQRGTSLLVVTFDLEGNKTSEKYFEISGLDKVLGATKIDDQVVINYTKNESGGLGEVYSSVFGGDLLEISGDKRLCWWEATGNDIYNGENFDVADGCNFYVNNGQVLELNATNRITLHPGFNATSGSSVSLRINMSTPSEDCPPPPGGRTEGIAKSVEVEIVDDQVGDNSLVGNIYAYPNPTRDWVSIAYVLEDFVDIKVTFYDIEGKQVAQYDYSDTNYINDKIHVGDMAKGIYVVQIESEIETRDLKISIK